MNFLIEICLLTRAKRVASVRCVTYCNLYSLDSSQFESVLQSYPLMRRTMESVAAERLNKLGKNPSIISTRHDLKRDAAVLKDLITRATPQPSSDSFDDDEDEDDYSSDSSSSSISSNEIKSKYSLEKHSDDQISQQNLNKKRRKKLKIKRKSSSTEKKFEKLSRLFLAAPSTTFNSNINLHKNQLRKSPSTPWSLFRKTNSPTPSFTNQSQS